jgi:hypothetical protein
MDNRALDAPLSVRTLVLLADDERAIRDGLVQVLRHAGVDVRKAGNGGAGAVAGRPPRTRPSPNCQRLGHKVTLETLPEAA